MRKGLFFALFVLLFSCNVFAYTDDEYVERAIKLDIISDSDVLEDNLSRADFINLLFKAFDFSDFDKSDGIIFSNIEDKGLSENLYLLSQIGVVDSNLYSGNYFNEKAYVTNYELNCLLSNIFKLNKNVDNTMGILNQFSNQFGIPLDFLNIDKKTAIVSIMKLIDELYFSTQTAIELVSPINGRYYSRSLDIDFDSDVMKHISDVGVFINDECVRVFKSEGEIRRIDISKYKSQKVDFQLKGHTKDGIEIISVPISITLNTAKSADYFVPSGNELRYIERSIKPNTYRALSNHVKPVVDDTQEQRLMFVSDSPEQLKNADGNILFDSDIQQKNCRILAYHENNLDTDNVYIKIDIENLGSNKLAFKEMSGVGINLYGNIAGYTSTENYFYSLDNKDLRYIYVNPYSVYTLVDVSVPKSSTFCYLGDLDFLEKGFYKIRVSYYVKNDDGSIESYNEKISTMDTVHKRGVFNDSNYNIEVDDVDVCFLIGSDMKKYSTEANINTSTYGVSDNSFFTNKGHYGELYNINIKNPDNKKILIALECRGTVSTWPAFIVFRDDETRAFGVNPEYSMYSGKQLILSKTDKENYKFTLTIPSGSSAPFYLYIIEEKE